MKTTTDAKNWKYQFTVSDLARFLGKSPVTVRGWERKVPQFTLPRDASGDRKLTCEQISEFATKAYELGRIDKKRLHLVRAAVTLLILVEDANADRPNRNPRVRKK